MKKLLILIVLALVSVNTLQAQKASKEITTTTFATDIDCESCERKIINSIPFKKGVTAIKVDIPTKRVTVSYTTSKSSDETIIKELEKIGVKATVAPCATVEN